MAARSKSNELHLTRIYDAPVEAVWDAWTDPEKVAKWWGPRGFSITTHSKDLRPGGHWKYTMHGPDGTDYPNTTTYFEVERCARLVYDHGASDDRPPLFRVTVVFAALGDRTRMEMTMALATPEAAEETRRFIKRAGGESTWDRLAEYLAKQRSGKELFVIHRSFAVGIERMYEAWTQPAQLAKWLPPRGFTMELIRADIREGGSSFYVMKGGNVTMYGRAHYRTLRQPELLAYDQEFVDAQERVSRHPFAPTWPATMRTTVAFTAEGEGQTRVTVVWEPDPKATSEELRAFIEERNGMTRGWTGSFDSLEELLTPG